jgi:general secretion pathway protein H
MKGFTLIEILVVLVIVGIILSFAVISFGDFGESRRIVTAGDHLQNIMKLAQQQAILESRPLGIKITNTTYQLYQLNLPATWSARSNKDIFKEQSFPKNTKVKLVLDFKPKPGTPDIIFQNSGDMTPFKLFLGNAEQPTLVTIIGQSNGQITASGPP